MGRLVCHIIAFVAALALPIYALAQEKPRIVFNGPLGAAQGGGNVVIGPEQKLMFEAGNRFMQQDYKGAEAVYSQVLQMNGQNVDAYLQRAAVRREMGDTAGMQTDARMALPIIDARLRQQATPEAYYDRSLALRFLKQFDAAEQSLRAAMRLNPRKSWENDFKAIALEKKMAQ